MPAFSQDGDTMIVTFTSGPRHVRLGLRFTRDRVSQPRLRRLPPIGRCQHADFDETQLTNAILAGVAESNEANGTSLGVEVIEYVSNDTPEYSLYQHCAQLLADRIGSGEPR